MSETGMNIYTYTDSMPLNIYVPVCIYIHIICIHESISLSIVHIIYTYVFQTDELEFLKIMAPQYHFFFSTY